MRESLYYYYPKWFSCAFCDRLATLRAAHIADAIRIIIILVIIFSFMIITCSRCAENDAVLHLLYIYSIVCIRGEYGNARYVKFLYMRDARAMVYNWDFVWQSGK